MVPGEKYTFLRTDTQTHKILASGRAIMIGYLGCALLVQFRISILS